MSRVRELPWRWIAPVILMAAFSLVVVVLGLLSDGTTGADDQTLTVEPAPSNSAQPTSTPSGNGHEPGSLAPEVPTLPTTRDPDTYAEAVAALVFTRDWHQHPSDYRNALHAGLDPEYVLSSEARDAIIATLDTRIPEPWLWERMIAAKQTNTFTSQHVWEPEVASDPRALEEWPVGVTVRNVQGVQALRYLDERGEFRTDQLTVTVTVYMVCPPARDSCTLLGVPREVEQ